MTARDRWAKETASKKAHQKRLEEEHGTGGHKKADTLYALAWTYGHSYGEHEVDQFYSEMADLIR